jgi:DNA-binding NarL/FixJ family response regulator
MRFPGEEDTVARVSLLLADNNRAMRANLQDELSKKFTIVGAVNNGEEAIREVVRLDPDILVLDITMPGLSGIQVTSHRRDSHVRTRILFLTIHEQTEYVAAAFLAGASGYVTKRRLGMDLAVAIHQVSQGQKFLSPTLRKYELRTSVAMDSCDEYQCGLSFPNTGV